MVRPAEMLAEHLDVEIARDLAFLKRLWLTLQERGGLAKAPTLLYSEADISLRVIRDRAPDLLISDVMMPGRDRNARMAS
mgnify:CR=1 FL=1